MNSTIKPNMLVKSFTKSGISSSTYYTNQSIDVSLSGHTPIGVVGWGCNQAVANLFRCEIVGNTLNVGVSTVNQGTISGLSVTVYVLYI